MVDEGRGNGCGRSRVTSAKQIARGAGFEMGPGCAIDQAASDRSVTYLHQMTGNDKATNETS